MLRSKGRTGRPPVFPPIQNYPEVYWNVITKDDSDLGGNLSDTDIGNQIAHTNKAFAGTGLSFKLAKVTKRTNAMWFTDVGPENAEEADMKRALRRGGAYDLNIYSVGFESPDNMGFLGYATFPWWYNDTPVLDGVVVRWDMATGELFSTLGTGNVLNHEIGHWAGLWHTFEGGCEGDGDFVDDTPAQERPYWDCPTDGSRDTCPDHPGIDATQNAMQGGHPQCMLQFTPGQVSRMREHMAVYRLNSRS